MTTVLRKFFKKFFNVDLDGNSTKAILANAIENINYGGGVDMPRIGRDEETGTQLWIGKTYTSIELKDIPVVYLVQDDSILASGGLLFLYEGDQCMAGDSFGDFIVDEDGNFPETIPVDPDNPPMPPKEQA